MAGVKKRVAMRMAMAAAIEAVRMDDRRDRCDCENATTEKLLEKQTDQLAETKDAISEHAEHATAPPG